MTGVKTNEHDRKRKGYLSICAVIAFLLGAEMLMGSQAYHFAIRDNVWEVAKVTLSVGEWPQEVPANDTGLIPGGGTTQDIWALVHGKLNVDVDIVRDQAADEVRLEIGVLRRGEGGGWEEVGIIDDIDVVQEFVREMEIETVGEVVQSRFHGEVDLLEYAFLPFDRIFELEQGVFQFVPRLYDLVGTGGAENRVYYGSGEAFFVRITGDVPREGVPGTDPTPEEGRVSGVLTVPERHPRIRVVLTRDYTLVQVKNLRAAKREARAEADTAIRHALIAQEAEVKYFGSDPRRAYKIRSVTAKRVDTYYQTRTTVDFYPQAGTYSWEFASGESADIPVLSTWLGDVPAPDGAQWDLSGVQ